MVLFSSIAPHLQIQIAEKIDYFDQVQFVLSSKHALTITNSTKHKSVVKVPSMDINETDMQFTMETPLRKYQQRKWNQFRRLSHIPRFLVSGLDITGDISLNSLLELKEKADFVQNKVYLFWDETCSPERFQTISNMNIWYKIIYFLSLLAGHIYDCNLINFFWIFNIGRVWMNGVVNPDLFNFSKFCEIEHLSIDVDFLPSEPLLQLKSPILFLRARMDPCRIVSVASSFFTQWFDNQRNIEWLKIDANKSGHDFSFALEKDIKLPFSIIWQFEGHIRQQFLLHNGSNRHFCFLEEGDVIFKIDRGDTKLLVFISLNKKCVLATEFTNLEDVILLK